MDRIGTAFARLAGVRAALRGLLEEKIRGRARAALPLMNFQADELRPRFIAAIAALQVLREDLAGLYSDVPDPQLEPEVEMMQPHPRRYSRHQLEALARLIDEVFEVRTHSELATPKAGTPAPRIFISHGRAEDWRAVQAYVERDIRIPTLELTQEPNLGRTILQKLEQESNRCTSAV